jgi:hypothetical protein
MRHARSRKRPIPCRDAAILPCHRGSDAAKGKTIADRRKFWAFAGSGCENSELYPLWFAVTSAYNSIGFPPQRFWTVGQTNWSGFLTM